MAKRRVEFHPAADFEVIEAQAWYAQRSAVAAAAFGLELDAVVTRVVDSPERWPVTTGGTRQAVFPRFPFKLVYRLRENIVDVIAVAHQRRRPGYWKRR